VGAGAAAHQARQARRQGRTIALRVLGLAQPNGDGAQTGSFDFGVMLL
jgi:hypothetical protein